MVAGFFIRNITSTYMENKLSELPFISISKENLMAAADMLTREEKGELMEMLIDAVLYDKEPKSNAKCVNGVFNQFLSVIERKSSSYFGRKKHIDNINDQKKSDKEEPQVPIEAVKVLPTVTIPAAQTMDYDDYLEELSKVEDTKGKQSRERMMNDTYFPYGAFERVYNDYIAYRTNG